jgi:hypothetical protein
VPLFKLFVEYDRHLARLTAGHKRIRFVRLLKRESVGNEVFGMNLPAHNSLPVERGRVLFCKGRRGTEGLRRGCPLL